MVVVSTDQLERISFQDELLRIKLWETDPARIGFTPKEIEKRLNLIEDQLADSKNYRNVLENYELLQALLGSFASHPESIRLKLLGAISSGFNKFIMRMEKLLEGCLEVKDQGIACGIYAVLVTAMIQAAEKNSSGSGASNKKPAFDWGHLKQPLCESIRRFMALELGRLIDVGADRDSIISHLVKSTHLFLENPNGLKSAQLKKSVFDVWCQAITRHNFSSGMKTIIIQDLSYYETLAEPLAEFIGIISQIQDPSPLAHDLLRQIGGHCFTSAESGSVKIVSIFLAAVSKHAPREGLRTISDLIGQLDCESYVMRMAMVEFLGNLLSFLAHQDKTDQTKTQIKSFLSILEERLMDVNAFVRAKVINIFSESLRNGSLPINQRARILAAVTDRISDKSSNVRRKAVQILGDFLRTHPFCVEGGELSLRYFNGRLQEIDSLITEISNNASAGGEDMLMSEASEMEGKQPAAFDPAKMSTLLLQKRYYADAIQFVRQLEAVIPTLCLLLSSTTKTEVTDVIDFFVEAYLYRLDGADIGLRRMMHLVWERDLSYEDGTKHSIKEYLFDAYKKVYLETDERLTGKERCQQIVQNLLSMMEGVTIAELTSLEPIIQAMLEKRWISDGVIVALFGVLSSSSTQMRSPLILLSMMSQVKQSVMSPKMDLIMKAGFGPSSDPLAAKYTLIALRNLALENGRLPSGNILLAKILDFCRLSCPSIAWFEPLTEAIKTVYALASNPSILCESLIQELFADIFHPQQMELDEPSIEEESVDTISLARLLHIVGQVTVCESAHLDAIERHWKSTNASSKNKSSKDNGELDQIAGGTAEDDFTDLVGHVRDNDLLFGENSLLALFGPLTAFICSNQASYPDQLLQRIASLTLAKMMSISAPFCEQQLALFFTILERSPDPVVRSNLVISFGDLVQAHARIIDANISFLFARLEDSDPGVRRNTLLVLTHLTLTGLIKVKGQIGEIAKCLLDEDDRIVSLTRLFFHELASKDPSIIYNHVPDILSTLTAPGTAKPMSEEAFQYVMKFVMEFIKKEKQMESLLEKLCQRFRLCADSRQSRDVTYCLSLISFNSDRTLKKLVEAFPLYQDKLGDFQTYRLFSEILAKARKSCKAFNGPEKASSAELKVLLEDFEAKLIRAAGDHADEEAAEAAECQTKKKPGKKPTRKGKFHVPSDDSEDDESGGYFDPRRHISDEDSAMDEVLSGQDPMELAADQSGIDNDGMELSGPDESLPESDEESPIPARITTRRGRK